MERTVRILVPLAEGSEELEAVAIVDVLRRAGAKVNIVSIGGKSVTCSKGVKIEAEVLLDEVGGLYYDAIVIPGGMPGAENIRNSEKFVAVLRNHFEKGAIIGAICASPAVVLDYHGITKGRRITCHPAFSHLVKHSFYSPDPLVMDSQFITGKSAGYAIDFALKLVELLFPSHVFEEVKEGMGLSHSHI